MCHCVICFSLIFLCFIYQTNFQLTGNTRVAFKLTEELLSVFPNHERAKGNLEYYRNILESKENSKRKKGEDEELVSFINFLAKLTSI